METAETDMGLGEGSQVVMLPTVGALKWELADVSSADHEGFVWARIKARGNREYCVCPVSKMDEVYGSAYYLVKRKIHVECAPYVLAPPPLLTGPLLHPSGYYWAPPPPPLRLLLGPSSTPPPQCPNREAEVACQDHEWREDH